MLKERLPCFFNFIKDRLVRNFCMINTSKSGKFSEAHEVETRVQRLHHHLSRHRLWPAVYLHSVFPGLLLRSPKYGF